MKNFFLVLIISPFFTGCYSDKDNSQSDGGLTIEKIENIKQQGFQFDKSNNYIKKNQSNQNASQKGGCTSACCAGKE